MARPTKLTPEVVDRITAALRAGAFPETAAQRAGVAPATWYRWLRAPGPEFDAFRDEVERAQNDHEVLLVASVTKAAAKSPMAALRLLEKRYRQRWGPRGPVDPPAADGPSDGPAPEETIVLDQADIERFVPLLLAAAERARTGTAAPRPAADVSPFEERDEEADA